MSSRPSFALAGEDPQHFGVEASLTYIWDVPTLTWVKSTGGGGGGGGAVTVADGADVAEGSTADAAWVSGAGTVISLLKTIASTGASAGLTDAQLRASPVPVSGTVAVTSAGLTNLDVALSTRLKPADTLTGVTTVGTVTTITNPVAVTGPLTDAQLRAVAVPVSGTVTTGGLTDAQLRASPIDVTGSFSASTAADVFAPEGDAGYTIGDTGKNLTQTDDGRLRVLSAGLISDVPNPYLDGDVRSLSMTNDGRLRVSTVPARYSVPFFSEDEEMMWGDQLPEYVHAGSPWSAW